MKQKLYSALLLVALVCALALPTQAADSPSAWAAESVEEAITLDFVPTELQGEYHAPVTRGQFASMAVSFVGARWDCTAADLHAHLTGGVTPASPFTDVPDGDNDIWCAWRLGIISGRGDGTFGAEDPITRQEAAVMLVRTYYAYAASPASPGDTLTYPDRAQVPDWARQSLQILTSWGVMGATGDGTFAPLGTYTREQCIVTFLRLYKNAPFTPFAGTDFPFSYEAEVRRILNGSGGGAPTLIRRYDTPTCTVLYTGLGNAPHGTYYELWIVYRTGGVRQIHTDLTATSWGYPPMLEQFLISEDKTKLTFCVTFLDNLAVNQGKENEWVLHTPGVTYFEVDLATAQVTRTTGHYDQAGQKM